jgi:8-oxo-dGTP pyrophosphatase MutT (NUDIX family)/GNAT superfamily N-acetyltransferase
MGLDAVADDAAIFSFAIQRDDGTVYFGDKAEAEGRDPELVAIVARIFSTAVEFLRLHYSSFPAVVISSASGAGRAALYKRLLDRADTGAMERTEVIHRYGITFFVYAKPQVVAEAAAVPQSLHQARTEQVLRDAYEAIKEYNPEKLKWEGYRSWEEFKAQQEALDARDDRRQKFKDSLSPHASPLEPEDLAAQGLDEDDFLDLHRTGHIPTSSYERMDDPRAWQPENLAPEYQGDNYKDPHTRSTYPTLRGHIATRDGRELDVLSRDEKLRYVKTDAENDIVRDEKGEAVYLSEDEIKAKGLPITDTTMVVFDGEQEVATASDEWGTDGIWVNPDYRRQGIGVQLLRMFRKQFPYPRWKVGQMTIAGEELTRAYYRKYKDEPRQGLSQSRKAEALAIARDMTPPEIVHYNWDKVAFGFQEGDILTLPVNSIRPEPSDEINVKGQDMAKYFKGEDFDKLPLIQVWFDGKTFTVYDGHHRLGYAKQLGLKEVRVEVAEIKANPIKALGFSSIDELISPTANLNQSFFADTAKAFAKDSGHESSINPDSITVYHGTSQRNRALILRQSRFKGFPFFALDEATARKFAGQAGGTPVVMALQVDPDALVPTGGYFSARMEGLVKGDDGIWRLPAQVNQALTPFQAKQVQTPEFRAWFQGSKVVGPDGQPLVVYHGTSQDFKHFDLGKVGAHFGDVKGLFFTNNTVHSPYEDWTSAGNYAKNAAEADGGSAQVMPCYIRLLNPLVLEDTYEGGLLSAIETRLSPAGNFIRDHVIAEGYDGLIVIDHAVDVSMGKGPDTPEYLVVATSPSQIKSALGNKGTFDDSTDITSVRKHALSLPENSFISFGLTPELVKENPHYAAAKAGSASEAVSLIIDLYTPEIAADLKRLSSGIIFIAPHAEEMSGRNAIPQVLANFCAKVCNGRTEDNIVQTNRPYHTGANMMERLASRVEFTGTVEKGGRYVLVDDNVTSGGTLADLGSYVVENGGIVVGVVALTTSSRSSNMNGSRKYRDLVERRFGHVVLTELGIDPQTLTEAEAQYLAGFKDADELRNRIARSRQDRAERLRSKGIRESAAPEGIHLPFGVVEPLVPQVCCPKCKSTNIIQTKSHSGPAACQDCGFSVADKAQGNPFFVTQAQAVGPTLTLWHGGNLEGAQTTGRPPAGTGTSRQEYGPGLYLTTHYGTAVKYAKGSRRLYRIVIRQGNDARTTEITPDKIKEFIDSNLSGAKKKAVTESFDRVRARGSIKADSLVAWMVNNEALGRGVGDSLRQFLVSNGVDYELVPNAFGWGEMMVVLYNMKLIISKEVITAKTKIKEFDLPTEFQAPVQSSAILSYGAQTLFLQLRAGTMEEMSKGLSAEAAAARARDNLNRDPNHYLELADEDSLSNPQAQELLYPLTNAVAYHGTLKDFGDFSSDYSGAGMGSQSYGWGIYFSGSKAVADYYRKFQRPAAEITTLSAGPIKLIQRGDYVDYGPRDSSPYELARASLSEELLSGEDALSKAYEEGSVPAVRSLMLRVCDGVIDYYEREDKSLVPYLKIFRKNIEVGLTVKADFDEGRVVTADIPDDAEYLDWDKSFSAQSPGVKAKLKESGVAADYQKNYGLSQGPANARGRAVSGENIYHYLSMREGSDKAASKYLLSIGIPGIKYVDRIDRDGVKDSTNYVVFDASRVQIKQARNQLVVAVPQAVAEAAPTGTAHLPPGIARITQTPAFKAWFGASKVVYEDTGEPMPVFHGSTHAFEEFKLSKTLQTNYWGQGLYFTTSAEDASANYATVAGPDFRARVDRRVDDLRYDYEEEPLPFLQKWLAIMHPEKADSIDFNDPYVAADQLSLLLPDVEWTSTMFEDSTNEVWEQLTETLLAPIATEELKGETNGMVYYVFLRCENPFMVKNPYPLKVETYNEETDDYDEDGEGVERLSELHDAFMEALGWRDFNEELWSGFISAAYYDGGMDAIDWAAGMEYLSKQPLESDDSGESVTVGAVIAEMAAVLGFDGICQPNPGREFRGMQGIYPGTKHWVVWNSTQVKAVFNKGGFDPKDPRINQSRIASQSEADNEHALAMDRTGYWGKEGAGALILCTSTGRLLMPLRSENVQEPGTWGTWGGAVDRGLSPEESVRKEIKEEALYMGDLTLVPLSVYQAPDADFRYHNFLALVEEEFIPHLNWETELAEWCELDDLPKPLHFGVEALLKSPGIVDTIRGYFEKPAAEPEPIESAAGAGNVWYRGSKYHDPLAMRTDPEGNQTEQYGPGIYFTTSPGAARGYGDVAQYRIGTSTGFVTPTTPIGDRVYGIGRLIKKAPDYLDTLTNFDEDPVKAFSVAVKGIVEASSGFMEALQYVANDFYHYDGAEFTRNCAAMGIKGLIIPDGEHKILVLYDITKAHKVRALEPESELALQ